MIKICKALLIIPLLLATIVPANAQRGRNDRYNNNSQYDRNSQFYNGVRQGGQGGQYNDPRYDNRHYDRDRDHNQGGIGPGKGALIGAGGGAILGALFGGGLKGTIIGGAAGAGIGAVVGKAHQDSQRNDHYRR